MITRLEMKTNKLSVHVMGGCARADEQATPRRLRKQEQSERCNQVQGFQTTTLEPSFRDYLKMAPAVAGGCSYEAQLESSSNYGTSELLFFNDEEGEKGNPQNKNQTKFLFLKCRLIVGFISKSLSLCHFSSLYSMYSEIQYIIIITIIYYIKTVITLSSRLEDW